ncbi:MAG: c-type cytochrome [Campylobacterales bacterium]
MMRWLIWIIGLLLVGSALIPLFVGLFEERYTASTPPPSKQILSPQEIYQSRCGVCHGMQGDGSDGYPRLNNQSAAELAYKLKGYKQGSYGKGTGAKSMGLQVADLDDATLEALAHYISQLKPNEMRHRKSADEDDKKLEMKLLDAGGNS